ncbi:unnamed protein product [Prorocentrum cordatum]|nr:unnamed protein product [Polarella glacialis]
MRGCLPSSQERKLASPCLSASFVLQPCLTFQGAVQVAGQFKATTGDGSRLPTKCPRAGRGAAPWQLRAAAVKEGRFTKGRPRLPQGVGSSLK